MRASRNDSLKALAGINANNAARNLSPPGCGGKCCVETDAASESRQRLRGGIRRLDQHLQPNFCEATHVFSSQDADTASASMTAARERWRQAGIAHDENNDEASSLKFGLQRMLPIGKSWHVVMELLEKGGGGRTTMASHGQRARSQGPHSVPAQPGQEACFRLQVRGERYGAAQRTQRAPSAVNEERGGKRADTQRRLPAMTTARRELHVASPP